VRDDLLRLKDILQAIERVERHTSLGHHRFLEDELVHTYIAHHLQVIGEAARSLSDDCRADMAEVPWPKIVGMRHALVHQYFQIDLDLVWDTAVKDVPELREQITEYIRRKGITLP